jgi:hypothetical protein
LPIDDGTIGDGDLILEILDRPEPFGVYLLAAACA